MKKFLIILSLSLGWCLPAHADVNDFKECHKDGTKFTCTYVNPYTKNPNLHPGCLMTSDNARKGVDYAVKEVTKPTFYKYCNPTYDFTIEAKTQKEAEQKAKDYLSKNP